MRRYEYKCQRCEERHQEAVSADRLEDTHFLPCPYCGFVSRRVAVCLLSAPSRAAAILDEATFVLERQAS